MSKTITIESDRESVCMADDFYSHCVSSEFPEDTKMSELISELIKIHAIASKWPVWSGYSDFCIKDQEGNWLIDKDMTIKDFFKDREKIIYFNRNLSFGRN